MNTTSPHAIAAAAADLWAQRHAAACMQVSRGLWSEAEADRRLRPWLAIACRAGADPAPLAPLLAAMRADHPNMPEAALRALCAEDICPRPIWAPMLAKARDRALDAHAAAGSPAAAPLFTRARALQTLCPALGVHLPYFPAAPERKAA